MKPSIYLRLSLLIPLLVWGISLLVLLAVSESPNVSPAVSDPLNLSALGTGDTFLSTATELPNYTTLNLIVAVISFVWGYICVGIGFGMYRILQRWGAIKDIEAEKVPAFTPS